MVNNFSIARPYAKAAFSLAQTTDAAASWDEFLQKAQLTFADTQVITFLADPKLDDAARVTAILQLLDGVTSEQENFLRLLVKNKRLAILPTIALLYKDFRDQQKNLMDVEVVAARPLTKQQQANLLTALQQRLQKTLNLQIKIDPQIIGGLVIKFANKVLDISLRHKLIKMQNSLVERA